MIRAVLAHRAALVRGALAHLLGAERDIDVIARVGRSGDVRAAVLLARPDVTVLDVDLCASGAGGLGRLSHRLAGSAVLVLAKERCGARLMMAMRRPPPGLGFLAVDAEPEGLLEAVRLVARGGTVVDPRLVAAARAAGSPLTTRETELLELAADGGTVREIAAQLGLSCGTVRNGVSRAIAKTGARTRPEAVRIAGESGWI
ncbi:response regulator transcription factor [Luedemannella flava]|uniref:Response regulator transcription factor n=1 Tax=Luedemannella flava TaxID=349316 RepID=A0ABN2M1A3_9ACTN